MRVRALSLWEPFATAFVLGLKVHETRSWATTYRGPVAIQASVRPLDRIGRMLANRYNITRLNYGHVVVIGDLVDCIAMPTAAASGSDFDFGDWSDGRFAWRFENLRTVGPFETRGRQGLWWIELPD